ncbi:MAG: 50S ribosomal protein L23 [uncultured bacterium]|jgi:large subunit ribosomal protein L23|uniref:50S ribosomal protein L23 n=2 Tax=Candidatus Collieribacteriota TaxID=1752725 RepID=A0A1F5FXH3_9BACT|nr:MAG: 50S ribosomal protein L23 [uncultured bacterium]KKU21601.1 MAG: 50S ribosomal protein L23 [Microgenomates group bacterium GW2011_GWF1_46_12]KKU26895.1 MAG: 50S ribosomal protein L23 [Microgenomates group bacterium GW2011_GWC1_46_16]KKU28311.1 MAG: 50S ribosomal protein L23 [Microgenomates group bacterium GW2011_GWF2_46_18]KKU44156.1 MAG: 50S ribosomal protein L23 [Microgenomates group bacterium GW2011_GWA1_46_7]KKU45534.1 MAG: 50S ribosomal protein L23 [Microgenomates group bacterium G
MILLKPIITEKSHQATSRGVFTFAVLPLASKSQIRQEVETLFKVNVLKITTRRAHLTPKKTGSRRLEGTAKVGKYARVQLKAGQTISLFDLKEKA